MVTDSDLNTCDECESEYYAKATRMKHMCPDCAHYLYGHDNCKHQFEKGRCIHCYWNGISSGYVQSLKGNKRK